MRKRGPIRQLHSLLFNLLITTTTTVVASGFDVDQVLAPVDAFPGQRLFGWSVSLSGSTALVGAPRDDDSGLDAGAVYIFRTPTGVQTAKVVSPDSTAGDWFGFSLAASEDIGVIGAPQDDEVAQNGGSAYLLDLLSGGVFAKLTNPDPSMDGSFGISVGIEGGIAVVGAHHNGHGGVSDTGAAYLFDTTTSNLLTKLTADDLKAGSLFGRSVAISKSRILVGAPNDASPVRSGAAYLFDANSGDQLLKLTPSDPAINDAFGWSVALSDKLAVIGAPEKSGFDGSAYVFDISNGKQLFKLSPSDPSDGLQFGRTVAISGSTILVGANGDSYPNTTSGSAYIFDAQSGMQLAKIRPSSNNTYNRFGWSGALDGGRMIVGSYNLSDANDAVFISIPEPSNVFMLAPLAAVITWRTRRVR